MTSITYARTCKSNDNGEDFIIKILLQINLLNKFIKKSWRLEAWNRGRLTQNRPVVNWWRWNWLNSRIFSTVAHKLSTCSLCWSLIYRVRVHEEYCDLLLIWKHFITRTVVQQLLPDDYLHTLEFELKCWANWKLIQRLIKNSLWFSNEASFYLKTMVNRHNNIIWGYEQPFF